MKISLWNLIPYSLIVVWLICPMSKYISWYSKSTFTRISVAGLLAKISIPISRNQLVSNMPLCLNWLFSNQVPSDNFMLWEKKRATVKLCIFCQILILKTFPWTNIKGLKSNILMPQIIGCCGEPWSPCLFIFLQSFATFSFIPIHILSLFQWEI